jgi:CheY-like chemotaxis protein
MAKAILLAEDSPDDVILFLHVMEKSGLCNPVIVVNDGDEVIAYLRGEREFADRNKFPMPEILMLDLRMPKVDGVQVLQWIRTQHNLPEFLIVVLSHFSQIHEVNRAYALGAHTFLTKPFKLDDLANLSGHFGSHWERTPARTGS